MNRIGIITECRRGMADLEALPETQGAYLEMTALCYQVFGDEITL